MPAIEKIDYSKIPDHIQDGMKGYIEQGRATGGFLNAVLSNDLRKSFQTADDTNLQAMAQIVEFLYWEVPADAWGSVEKVKAWREKGGAFETKTEQETTL